MGGKIQSTTDSGSLNAFGRNEIEVAHISSALLRIACLVILYKTCGVPDQELAADWSPPAEWSTWNVSLRLVVSPAWPAEPVGVAQPATRRMQARTPLALVACIRLRRGA